MELKFFWIAFLGVLLVVSSLLFFIPSREEGVDTPDSDYLSSSFDVLSFAGLSLGDSVVLDPEKDKMVSSGEVLAWELLPNATWVYKTGWFLQNNKSTGMDDNITFLYRERGSLNRTWVVAYRTVINGTVLNFNASVWTCCDTPLGFSCGTKVGFDGDGDCVSEPGEDRGVKIDYVDEVPVVTSKDVFDTRALKVVGVVKEVAAFEVSR